MSLLSVAVSGLSLFPSDYPASSHVVPWALADLGDVLRPGLRDLQRCPELQLYCRGH